MRLGADMAKAKAALRRVKGSAPKIQRSLRKAMAQAETSVVKGSFQGYSGPAKTARLKTRSGLLRNSVRGLVHGDQLDTLRGELRASAPYARTHEYGRGATQSTSGKRFYPIPAAAALTPAGVLRKPITAYRDGFFFRNERGTLLFGRRKGRGKSARVELLFTLLRFPTRPIPPRLGMRKAMAAAGASLVADVRSIVTDAIRGVL